MTIGGKALLRMTVSGKTRGGTTISGKAPCTMAKTNNMKTILFACVSALIFLSSASAAEFHVAIDRQRCQSGTQAAPFRTIQHAADLAQPGDVITVHPGVYRERISPPRGGESDAQRIVYQAAPGEKVEIKGSEVVRNWVKAAE